MFPFTYIPVEHDVNHKLKSEKCIKHNKDEEIFFHFLKSMIMLKP